MILLGEWIGAKTAEHKTAERRTAKHEAEKRGALTSWREGLQKRDQAILDAKLAMLQASESLHILPNLVGPITVGGKPFQGIFKLRIRTPTLQLRPLFCKHQPPSVLVFLVGATERDHHFHPKNAPSVALERRQEVSTEPKSWRLYEGP